MNLLFLRNPEFVTSQSMPRFARMITQGMEKRGHNVAELTARPYATRLTSKGTFGKWLGYFDRFVLFRGNLRRAAATASSDTLVVSVDQALGPWMPFFKGIPTVTHAHDMLSIRAALGEFPHVSISATGKMYNHYIRQGLRSCCNYICVSEATETDVRRLLSPDVTFATTVYNGFNAGFEPGDARSARSRVSEVLAADLSRGFVLHVGGDNWYKNRPGVVRAYDEWRASSKDGLPLVLVGPRPSGNLADIIENARFRKDVYCASEVGNELLADLYRGARVLLFPSIAEGFGWPIAEAMACGCAVVTTVQAPMTEVGETFAYYVPVMPADEHGIDAWARAVAPSMEDAVNAQQNEQRRLDDASSFARRKFSSESALDQIEAVYHSLLARTRKP